MSYTHAGRHKITLINDPIDPDSTDWFYFVYGDWIQSGETIASHSALLTGCTEVTASTYYATRTDNAGVTYSDVYGVQVSVNAGVSEIEITHRVSTQLRLNIDHTIRVAVRDL